MSAVQNVLVYGDSVTWGIIPETRKRLPFEDRWPGVLENELNATGNRVRMIEDCLNGRRTVWDDPFKPGRNGLAGLAQRIEANSPLSLVILMLGTNDFQSVHPQNDASSASRGIEALVNEIRRAPIEAGMPVPPILIVCPPPSRTPRGTMEAKFRGADQRCSGLAQAYGQVASMLGCHFFDASEVIHVSEIDGVHVDKDQHRKLGEALVGVVQSILR